MRIPDDVADRIKNPKSLTNLCVALNEAAEISNLVSDNGDDDVCDFETALLLHGLDISDLPNFGGDEPADTVEIWSWDKESLLVTGSGDQAFMVVSRDE